MSSPLPLAHLRAMSCPILTFTGSARSPSLSPTPHSPVVDAVYRFFKEEGKLWVDLGFKRPEDGEEFMDRWDHRTATLTPLTQLDKWGVRLSCHCLHLEGMFTALFKLRPELKLRFLDVLAK